MYSKAGTAARSVADIAANSMLISVIMLSVALFLTIVAAWGIVSTMWQIGVSLARTKSNPDHAPLSPADVADKRLLKTYDEGKVLRESLRNNSSLH